MSHKKTRSGLAGRIALFLAVVGPGIITGSVDNDAGGITTYSIAGASYGYGMLWTLIPALLVLFVVQEMNARMGIVTGKGLADLIRENAGVKLTFLIFACLLVADIGNTASEFAGVANSTEVLGVSKYLSVPASAFLVWLFVVKGSYKSAEKVFLALSLFLLSYVVSAVLARPDWAQVGAALTHPLAGYDSAYLGMGIAIIGTTIAPWMQFYMQSSVIEKRLTVKDLKYERLDVIVGSVITIVVAFFIMVACAATLHAKGVRIESASDAALALGPLAGEFASVVFAAGLYAASVFAAAILPLAASFYVCEAFGFEAGIDKKWREAPQFYGLFTAIMAIGVAIVLFPGAPLMRITVLSQLINGIFLPVVLICMLVIINKKEVMGEHVNRPLANVAGWGIAGALVVINVAFVIIPVLGL